MSRLTQMVLKFKGTPKRAQFITGQNYYNSHNEVILGRRFQSGFQTPTSENKFDITVRDNLFKANNKVTSAWYKLLIDQKINYLLGKPPTYTEVTADLEDISDGKIKEFFNNITSLFKKADTKDKKLKVFYNKKFDRVLKSVSKTSSIKGLAWGHAFIEDGILKTKLIEPDNIIPIFEDEKLISIFKFWITKEIVGKKEVETLWVEKWTDETVTLIKTDKEKDVIIWERPHIVIETLFKNGTVVVEEEHSWGRVPFMLLINNKEQTYDLQPIKTPIDGYDIVSSDFLNNLEDFQDIFWILKNYQGQDLKTFLKQVKEHKVIKVGQDGDAKAEKIDIPHEARKIALELARMNIFDWGMGVDTKDLAGGNLTNAAIMTRYFNLKMKVEDFMPFVEDYIDQYQFFVNRFIEINKLGNPIFVDVIFNTTTPINEKEMIEAMMMVKGDASDRTRYEKMPFIKDVDQEFERLKEEREARMNEFRTGGENNANNE